MKTLGNAVLATTALALIAAASHDAAAIQCARYARIAGPVKIRGDAWTWWDKAIGLYARTRRPTEGAAMVFSKTRRNRFGHIAVVSEVIGDRVVKVFHANWLNRGRIHKDQLVVDVSEAGDWSRVRVWNPARGRMGKHHFPVRGFISPTLHPRHDEFLAPESVMAAAADRSGRAQPVSGLPLASLPRPTVPARFTTTPDRPWIVIAAADLPAPPLPNPRRAAANLPDPPVVKPTDVGSPEATTVIASAAGPHRPDDARRTKALEQFGLTTGPVARFLPVQVASETAPRPNQTTGTTVIAGSDPSRIEPSGTGLANADGSLYAPINADTVVIAALPATVSDTSMTNAARARAAAEAFGLTSGPVAKFLPQIAQLPNRDRPTRP